MSRAGVYGMSRAGVTLHVRVARPSGITISKHLSLRERRISTTVGRILPGLPVFHGSSVRTSLSDSIGHIQRKYTYFNSRRDYTIWGVTGNLRYFYSPRLDLGWETNKFYFSRP